MKIEIQEKREVEIDETSARRITISYLCQVFNWDPDFYISDGKVYRITTYHTSHSWSNTEMLRTATEQDLIINSIIEKL